VSEHNRNSYLRGCRCAECKQAQREYQRQYRANPTVREYDRWQKATYVEAQRILRERHHDEFEQILAEVRSATQVAS
jgi:hypothetical protein